MTPQEAVNKIRTHDAAQRARITQLEELAARQAELLGQLARFFLEDNCKVVHAQIQAQLVKYIEVVTAK